jgi:fatty-acid desaturase
LRAGLNALLQARRQSAAANELLFEPWGKSIFLSQTGWQMILIFGVPTANRFMIVMFVIGVAVVVIVLFMFVVTLTVSVSVILRESMSAGYEENTK